MLDKQAFKKYATKHLGLREELLDHHIGEVEGMTRTVIEERPKPFREIDVFSRLIMNRIIFLGSAIDDKVANVVTAQLLFLESVNPEKQITLYINSPGGSVYDGLAIYDTMQYVKSPISTACIGLAASMGAVLLTGGEKGLRAALPHSRIMIHQPLGKAQGQMVDMEISVKQILALGEDLYKILAEHTGQDFATIQQDANRDYWMRAHEAKSYGLIDKILSKN